MDQLAQIRAEKAAKHRRYQLETSIIPSLGLLITLDPVLRSACRIQRCLKGRWFKSASPFPGMMTFRTGERVMHLLDEVAPLLVETDVYELPGMLTQAEVLRARQNIAKAQDLKFEQDLEYGKSLARDRNCSDDIYHGYLAKKAVEFFPDAPVESAHIAVEHIKGILEENVETLPSLKEVVEFLGKVISKPVGNTNLLEFQLDMKLYKYDIMVKPHLVLLTYLGSHVQPSWFPLEFDKCKAEVLSSLESSVRSMIAMMKSREEYLSDSVPMETSSTELVECPGCCNEFGQVDLWPLSGSPDDDFRVCITCYKSMCGE